MVAALLTAGAASASTLQVSAAEGSFTIATRQSPGVYRTTVLVPTEYTLHAGGAHGTATVTTAAKTLHGTVRSVPAAPYDDDACASNVGYDHVAVWIVRAAGVQFPVYVDAGPQGTTLLTWCAAPATRLPVVGVSLSMRGAFDRPAVHGSLTWRAEFDGGTTQQIQAVVRD